MRIDLHTHSCVSDGTDTPGELIAAAALADLDVVALTDHDTFDGVAEAAVAAERYGIEVMPGAEFSAEWRGREVHLLGYGLACADATLADEMTAMRSSRVGRISEIVGKLNDLGIDLTIDEVHAQATAASSLGRPHIADALVARGVVSDRVEAFNRYLAPGQSAYVDRYKTPLTRLIDLIRQAGGVSVIAHPWGRGRQGIVSADELGLLVHDYGLDGIEVDHPDHDEQMRERLRGLADEWGVIVTGSSDYHGTGKLNHELGVNLTTIEMWQRIQLLCQSRSGGRLVR